MKKKTNKPVTQQLLSVDLDIEWQKIRCCEAELQELFTVYIVDELGIHLIKQAEEEFALFGKFPVNVDEWDSLFSFWIHYVFVPESFEEIIPIAQRFLQEHPERLTEYQKKFIKASVNAPCTFYLVKEVIPERGLLLYDMLLQKQVFIKERMATLGLKEGLVIYGRHVTVEGQSIQLGLSPYSLPKRCYNAAKSVRTWLLAQRGTKTLNKDYLLEWDFEIREAFFVILEQASKPPEMINEDKEKIVIHEIHYRLACSQTEAYEKLKSMCPEEFLEQIGVQKQAGGVLVFHWGEGDRAFADIMIDSTELKILVNSTERAERVQREIQDRLGAAASLKNVNTIDLGERMKQQMQEGL
jgi:hypothetical protein